MANANKEKAVSSMNQLSQEVFLGLLEKMQTIRYFEEAATKAYQQKKIAGFLHAYIGQEAVGVGILAHKLPQDMVVTSYRCHGLYLTLGCDAKAGMAELFGRASGCAGGKGGSMHFFSKEKNFLGGHGIVGGQFPIGIGAAFKSNYEEDNAVSFIFFGDGALPQGSFHESMNLAALWDLPVVFVCEDNQYGMGTANTRSIANTEIAAKAEAYGIKGYTLDGMNVAEVYSKMGPIVQEVRATRRPVLIHAKTYRYVGHSVSDAGLYRTKDEVEQQRKRDPLVLAANELLERKWISEEELKALQKSVKAKIAEAVDFADESPEPSPEALLQDVFADPLP